MEVNFFYFLFFLCLRR